MTIDKQEVIENITTIFNTHMDRFNNEELPALEADFNAAAMALVALKELKSENSSGKTILLTNEKDFKETAKEEMLESKFVDWEESINTLGDFEQTHKKIITNEIGFPSYNNPYISSRKKEAEHISQMSAHYINSAVAIFG